MGCRSVCISVGWECFFFFLNLNVGVFLVLEGLENFAWSFLTFGILVPKKKLSCSILVEVYIEPLHNPNKLAMFTLHSAAILLF